MSYAIKQVAVVDDKPDAREAMAETIIDANLAPILISESLKSINEAVHDITKKAEAAIFDHHLSPRNYASFDGAAAVAQLYLKHFPALLITSLSNPDMDQIRPFRRQIPVLIRSGEIEPNSILEGFEKCLKEFSNQFTKERRPWRTLVRIEDVDTQLNIPLVYVVVPQWDPKSKIRLPLEIIRKDLPKFEPQPDMRLVAKVNAGAYTHEDLYFENFEIAAEPEGEYANLVRS